MSVWMEPGADYLAAAMHELCVRDVELDVDGEAGDLVVIGHSALLDAVYAKAWELREADE
jgi:hypothetical protein